MKSVRCGDLGFECGYEVEAETEGGLLRQVAEHATAVHQITVTPTLVAQVGRSSKSSNLTRTCPGPECAVLPSSPALWTSA
jgi:predicted small metal-binding protein